MDTEKKDQAPSVRDSLVAALKEQQEGGDDAPEKDAKGPDDETDDNLSDDPAGEGVLEDDKQDQPELKEAKSKKPEKQAAEKEQDKDESSDTQDEETADSVDTKDGSVERKPKATVVAAPDNWKNEADWDKLPSKIRQRIIKREAEVSAGIKQYSDKAKAFDEYEVSIGPRRQELQRLGVSPAQVIHAALNWMDALAERDPVIKDRNFRELARRYGYNINALASGNNGSVDNNSSDPGSALPDDVRQYVNGLEQKIAQLEQNFGNVTQTFEQQQLEVARSHMNEWAADKPHFNAVSTLMGQLIHAGSAPMKDGRVDMDALYDMAVHATPSVRELVRLEEAEKAKQEREAKAKKERQAKQLAINKARAANGSLKPGAPASPSLNGGKPGLSVRDTIRASLKELQE